jgi:hypothetical protein
MIFNRMPMFSDPDFSKKMTDDKFTGLDCSRITEMSVESAGNISFNLEY